MNKKFILIILAFTLTVPGFFVFSYWYLGIFSGVEATETGAFAVTLQAGRHYGDYNKAGEEVVKTRRLLASFALPCEPVLVYFDNAITVGKPYLRSAGGCITESTLPPHVVAELKKLKLEELKITIAKGYKLTTRAQTAVALRKTWTELARLSDKGIELKFPLVQIVRESGQNDFFIGAEPKK